MLGTVVGPYEVLERLGAGGMGEVFLGHDPRLRRRVALKTLNADGQSSEHIRSRVFREARAAARLNHPNIASVYDVLEDAAVIVMEYVEGQSLHARLDGGPLPSDQVIAFGCQLADALSAAHAQGVIHRDLKPSNIRITSTGIVKVLDFGVARINTPLEQTGMSTTTGDASLLGGNPGTPIYMAPEQLIGGVADERSDIYSLGVVLFEMATGSRPYLENDPVGLAVAMSTTEARAADAVNAAVPHALSDVIAKALAREPRERFRSAAELAGALMRLRHPSDGDGPARSESRGISRLWLIPVTALTVVVTGAVPRLPWDRTEVAKPPDSVAVVLGIVPVENRAGDVRGKYVGAALASVVAANFGSVSGVTVLPAGVTRELSGGTPDADRARRESGVTHLVVLTVRAVAPSTVIDVALRRSATGEDLWSRTIEGDPLTVERLLLDQLGAALTRGHVLQRRLSPDELARMRKLPTTSPEALQAYAEGRAFLDGYDVAGNVDRAIELFNRATALDPHFAIAFAALGEALWHQYTADKRPEVATSATAAVTKALSLDADLAPVHYALGLIQSQTGHPEEAVASLRQALARQPADDETHRLLGRVLSTLGDHQEAIAEVQRAIALRPVWTNYYSLGYVLYASGNYQAALDAFQKTIEQRPTYSSAYQMAGTMYHMLGDLPQAIGNYEHAVRLDANAAAYANLGLAYYAARQYELARHAYDDAIARQPRRATLHKSLGDVYIRLGRTADARRAYQQAMALAHEDLNVNPRDATAVVLIANCEARLGRRAEAERHAAEAIVLAPSNRDVWIRTAKAYVALDEQRRAREAVEKAVSLGYEPTMIAGDDELAPIGPALKQAIDAGLAARQQKGALK